MPTTPANDDRQFMTRTLEAAVRIGVLALLLLWCFVIAQPFLVACAWGDVMV